MQQLPVRRVQPVAVSNPLQRGLPRVTEILEAIEIRTSLFGLLSPFSFELFVPIH
jgi:hypothetical protein